MLAGKPLNEPAAWYGPMAVNSKEGLVQAFRELREETYVMKAALWKDLAP